jgi:hypothetical protein
MACNPLWTEGGPEAGVPTTSQVPRLLNRRVLTVTAAGLLACGCGPDHAAGVAAEGAFVPEGLVVRPLAGGNGVLTLSALTLFRSGDHNALYASLENRGTSPACDAALSVELFDRSEQSLAAGIGGLLSPRVYRLTDGSNALATCVGPGEVSVATITDLPADFAPEDVSHVIYHCPYFALDVAPSGELTVQRLHALRADDGITYAGTLFNGSGVTLRNPTVSVFPINRARRPLGMAQSSAALELRAAGSWSFQTDRLPSPTSDQLAFASGSLVE